MNKNLNTDLEILQSLINRLSDEYYRIADFSCDNNGNSKFTSDIDVALCELGDSIKYLDRKLNIVGNYFVHDGGYRQ